MLGIYVSGDAGGFLNPAITFCFCLYRGLPWRRFPVYLLAQFLGGFIGPYNANLILQYRVTDSRAVIAAGVIYGNYIKGIDNYEGLGVRTGKTRELVNTVIFQSLVCRGNVKTLVHTISIAGPAARSWSNRVAYDEQISEADIYFDISTPCRWASAGQMA